MEEEIDYKELRIKIMRGFRLAIKHMIQESKKKNEKLVIYRNGKIVKVNANEL